MNAHRGDNDAQSKVERYEESVQSASGPSEEPVQNTRHRDGCYIKTEARSNENKLPETGTGLLPLLQTGFRPAVSEVDQED